MKIGLSFSRCVLDIVEERVNIVDVLVIIARTDFDPTNDKQWAGIWSGYSSWNGMSHPEWAEWADVEGAEERFRNVAIELWESGKLHQPRKFGAHAKRMPYYWVETILPDSELDERPAVKDAWERFQILAGLSNVNVDTSHR